MLQSDLIPIYITYKHHALEKLEYSDTSSQYQYTNDVGNTNTGSRTNNTQMTAILFL